MILFANIGFFLPYTKNNGRIKVEYNSNDEYENSIKEFINFISSETLSLEFVRTTEELEGIDINGYKV